MIFIDYEHGVPPIFEYFEDFIDKNYGNLLASISYNSLISFFKMKANSNTQFESIGTGFICELGRELYLVTACHVVRQIIEERNNPFYVYIPGILGSKNIFKFKRIIKLEEDTSISDALVDECGDTIFIPINEEIISKDKLKNNAIIPFVPFSNQDRTLTQTSSFMIFGFPSNKNQFHKNRDKEPEFSAANLIFHKTQYDPELNTIYFFCDKKNNKVESNSTYFPNIKDFFPAGMSGSPVFQFYIMKVKNGFRVLLVLIGIFTEFKKNELRYKATVLENERYIQV